MSLRQALTAALVGMASVRPRSLLCLAAGCCLLCASAALSEKEMREVEKKFKDDQFNTLLEGIGKDDEHVESAKSRNKKTKKVPINVDVPYIKCEVCRLMAGVAYDRIAQVNADHPERKAKVKRSFEVKDEARRIRVDEVVEQLCDADLKRPPQAQPGDLVESGEWLAAYDIRMDAATRQLKLHHMINEGKCRRECRTIEKACNEVLEQVDDEMGEALLQIAAAAADGTGAADPRQAAVHRVCNRLSDVCKKGRVPAYEGERAHDEVYPAITEKDRYYEELKARAAARRAVDPKGGGLMDRTPMDEEYDEEQDFKPEL